MSNLEILRSRPVRFAVAALTALLVAAAAAAAEASEPASGSGDGGPLRIGEEVSFGAESPHPYTVVRAWPTAQPRLIWSTTISHPGATYVTPHFSRFDLAPGDEVVVRAAVGSQEWRYREAGRGGRGPTEGFWSSIVYGDETVVELWRSGTATAWGLRIDRYARGYTREELDARNGKDGGVRPEWICTGTDYKDAICYSSSEATSYTNAKAVARLIINGTGYCTGWLVGSAGHLMTNNHCVSSSTTANNTDAEFMFQATSCGPSNYQLCLVIPSGCHPSGYSLIGGNTVVKTNVTGDYTLMTLDSNPAGTYGYYQMRSSGGTANERIYMPNHSSGYGKILTITSDDSHDSGGYPKLIAWFNDATYGKLWAYFADMEPGASGSPVVAYSDQKVVALNNTQWGTSCSDGYNAGPAIEDVVTDIGTSLPLDATTFTITVAKSGTGSGTVTSSTSGISCGSTCSASFGSARSITLTATPADSCTTFAGWSGDSDCSDGVLSMYANKNCTATFTAVGSPTLTISKAGTGTGTVTSNTGGINCGATCSASFACPTVVTLTATAGSCSTFAGWSGTGCGSSTTMTATRNCTATFTLIPYTFEMNLTGSAGGTGTVTSTLGLNCGAGSYCGQARTCGDTFTLTATPATCYYASGWTGSSDCSDGSVTMSTDITCGNTFLAMGNQTLTVSKSGAGSGTVTSNVGGISCGATCSASISCGTSVTLTAVAADSCSTFTGWSGACSGTGTCTVSMTAARSVTAIFGSYAFPASVSTTTDLRTAITCANANATSDTINLGADLSVTDKNNTTDGNNAFPSITSTITLNGQNHTVSRSGSAGETFRFFQIASGGNLTLNDLKLTGGSATNTDGSIVTDDDGGAIYSRGTLTVDGCDFYSNVAASTGGLGGVVRMNGGTMAATDSYFRGNSAQYGGAVHNLSGTLTMKDCIVSGNVTTQSGGGLLNVTNGTSTLINSTVVGNYAATWGGGVNSSDAGSALNLRNSVVWGNGSGTSYPQVLNVGTMVAQNSGVEGGIASAGGTITDSGGNLNLSSSASIFRTVIAPSTTASTAGNYHLKTTGSGLANVGSNTLASGITYDIDGESRILDSTVDIGADELCVYTLTTAKSGTGSGTITTSTGGTSCGSTCSESLDCSASTTLTATPDSCSTFSGWSGACSGTGTCTLSMTAAKSATATFAMKTFTLSVAKSGTGSGTVTADSGSLSCGATCSASYGCTTSVTLTATPASCSTFTGWSGACSGTGTCTVSMSQAQSVTATFAATGSQTLTVTKAGTGSGTVTASSGSVSCGATCSGSYTCGTSVTLTATAASCSSFTGWSGACSGTGTCTVSMTQAQNATATFTATSSSYTLSVVKVGDASDTVSVSSGSLNCVPGPACTASYSCGTTVTLTATPGACHYFSGWSGGGCSGTSPCTVSMTQAQSVNATFLTSGYSLTVSKAGTGSGTVTSDTGGISCGATCSSTYTCPTLVTLAATPSTSCSTFAGWSGGPCSGTGTCSVSMTAAQSVTATFTAATGTDSDGDGSPDSCDSDDDNDGVADASDCASTNPAVWSIPTAAPTDLVLTKSTTTTLSWSAIASSAKGGTTVWYYVQRSTSPNSFSGATCIGGGQTGTTSSDSSTPSDVYYYLVPAGNSCGKYVEPASDGSQQAVNGCS